MTSEISRTKMGDFEAAAKASATTHVINMLQRPGQLDKVEQYKRQLVRKKASVETLLKSAMQQQLDGVNNGLKQLHDCLKDVRSIDVSMKTISTHLTQVPQLLSNLHEVREENMRHSQYVTARENLKHIFTVPESVARTKELVNDGKLLQAHHFLRDLENSRDDLLFELHKLPNQSPHDKSLLKAYFADVQVLSSVLEKQLRLILSRTLNTVRKEPTVIVTALRIIEREEKADAEVLKQQRQSGFQPPGRPKSWKKMCFEVLEQSVATRIEGTHIDDRQDNKHWLIRHLELCRQLILEDLRVVKSLCVPCFPPSYNIIYAYVEMYHNCLSRRLQELITNGIEGTEYVSMLNWVLKVYKSEELLAHSDLQQYTSNLGPLLANAVVEQLQNDYLKIMSNNYTEWMKNTVNVEEEEWRSPDQPLSDTNSKSTAAPIIIFQMIDQNLQVAATISDDFTGKVLKLSIEHIIQYGDSYRRAVTDFKTKYFEDRKQVPYFTQHMIIILNNCQRLTELGTQLEKQYWSLAIFLGDVFNRLRSTFVQLRNDSGDFLLDELFLDIDKKFAELFTSKWWSAQAPIPVDTICATLDDYLQDYSRLVDANFVFIVHQARMTVGKRYLAAMLSKRMTFKTFEECQQAATKISKETTQLKKLFSTMCPQVATNDSGAEPEDGFVAIGYMVELLKSDDDMLSFELHRAVDKFPDISDDHLMRVLSLRGDLNKGDVREKIAHVPRTKNTHQHPTVFKSLVFQKLINLNVFNN